MPTSRYCDHRPRSISASRSSRAAGLPGLTRRRSPPMRAVSSPRSASARAGSPAARSSITRSSMLAAKVTPQALTACRSQGASSQGRDGSRAPARLLASRDPRSPIRRPMVWRASLAGSGAAHSSAMVGAAAPRSKIPAARIATTAGPAIRPSAAGSQADQRAFIAILRQHRGRIDGGPGGAHGVGASWRSSLASFSSCHRAAGMGWR